MMLWPRTTISPIASGSSRRAQSGSAGSMMPISTPQTGRPMEPGRGRSAREKLATGEVSERP